MKTARYIPPEGELSVWCFVHQLAIEQERGRPEPTTVHL
jgi:hypothetical protein